MTIESPPRATAWLSEGLECLVRRLHALPSRANVDFDVVVVGSGYGGAIAASTLAGRNGADGRAVSVCVLERGKEYLPGAYPSGLADLAGHVRFSTDGTAGARGNREGLFDIKVGTDVSAMVANGLGGGSLINAGVMLEPSTSVRQSLEALTGDLAPFYERARRLLGAAGNTIEDRAGGAVPLKFSALRGLAQRLGHADGFAPAPITVSMRRHRNEAGIELDACRLCGDCATGCNFNAKESLDTNLLVQAKRAGAELFTGATVLRIERDDALNRWRLHIAYTDEQLRKRMPDGLVLHAAKLILAAGTYGSTEILMRSRSKILSFSPMLGQRFSSNGDMIVVAYRQKDEVNAVADEHHAPSARQVGPTITGMIRVPDADGELLVQELAVPGPMRRIFEEIFTTADTLHRLGRPDRGTHGGDDGAQDPCAVDAHAIGHSAVLAVMGDDGAAGKMRLAGARGHFDGGLLVHWPELRYHRVFERQAALLAAGNRAGPGVILPNPMWKLLPDDMAYLLKGRRGPLLTVHPLGGCPIGTSAVAGAVNANGQVYRTDSGAPDAVYDTLAVLDGAMLPCALGVNPALTIAALALRAVGHLCRDWALVEAAPAPAPGARPRFRLMPEDVPAPLPTVAGFVERMTGPVRLRRSDGVQQECMLELTLRFDPRSLGAMFLPEQGRPVAQRRVLDVGARSEVAIYDLAQWRAWRSAREGTAAKAPPPLLRAPLAGTLAFFHREPSSPLQRTARALLPWLRNRGMRDTWQWWFSPKDDDARADGAAQSGWQRLHSAFALASRAGEVRRFDYRLTVSGPADASDWAGAAAFAPGAAIEGHKRLTYAYAANPWQQLMRMTLTACPALAAGPAPAVLELDTGFLVQETAPLMRILRQQDQPSALADAAGMLGYLLRLLLSIHMWSFRKPDVPPPRIPQRLPPPLPGLRMDRVTLAFPDLPDGSPVAALLTRYRSDAVDARLPPVLMIHGYSASGTTFAHATVQPNLAGFMCARGRDVWVLDMRTSSGMPTATHPWQFEDPAHNDIPLAVARICALTGCPRIDIVAHCMGAAMLGMAVLGGVGDGVPHAAERLALPGRINRVVLSQVGPVVVFSQANIFRAYLMSYARHLLPRVAFPFTVEGKPGMADELVDRLLATLPYPLDEFRRENPAWPWQRANFAGTRHRMDALYGRDFQLANLGAPILDRIDDFFGPYNLVTLNQAIHFARLKTITNRAGRNAYVSRRRLRALWHFPTLSVHGADNGLADVSTLARMDYVLRDAGCSFRAQAFPGYGHQDCLIGRGAVKVFETVAGFLDEHASTPTQGVAGAGMAADPGLNGQAGTTAMAFIARPPATGPLRSGMAGQPDQHGVVRLTLGAAASAALHQAEFVALVPVVLENGRYTWFDPDGDRDPAKLLIKHAELFSTEKADDEDGWVQLPARPAPPGAAGVMMLMLYSAAPGFEPPPGFDLVEQNEWMSLIRHAGHDTWTASEQVRWIRNLTAPVGEAIQELLADWPASALRGALVGAMDHDARGAAGAGNAGSADPPPATVAAPAGAIGGSPASPVCFAVASCQYPAGMLDNVPAYASYARLAARLDSVDDKPKPTFIALLGDQIYADATAGLFDPTALDDRYVRPYEKLFANIHVKDVLRRLPALSMLDDHEIEDDWEPGARGRQKEEEQERMAAGVAAYLKFQRTADLPGGAGVQPVPGQLDFAFSAGGLPFYLADTRTGRMARSPANIASAHIMNEAQFDRMIAWLHTAHATHPDAPKFLATPSIVAPGRVGPGLHDIAHCLRYDGWAGYPASLHRLLACIADSGIRHLVLLSGDEHISCDATISIRTGDGAPLQIRAIHSSALYAPFPFANSRPADMADECYAFSFAAPGASGRMYHCEVRSRYVPGDGFAVITAHQGAHGWEVDCDFDRA